FDDFFEDYDAEHPLTLGRLAHTYAILWTEHGEPVKDRLDEVLALALDKAGDISHTVAAAGLTTLATGKDRPKAAKAAYEAVWPMVDRTAKGGAAPTHADLTLGIIELDIGEYDQAAKRLDRVKQVLPGSVRAQVWHARAAFKARRLGTALAAYRGASRAEPSHAGALAGQALTYLERGDITRAGEALKRFDELQRTNPKQVSTRDSSLAVYARSALLRADGQDGKANGLYEEAVRADPRNADFPFGLGHWLLQNDRALEALIPLEQAVAMEPSRWVFHVEIAEAEMMVGQWEQAKVNIDEALQLAPDKSDVHLAKARWMRRRRQPDTESYLHAMLKKYPSAKMGINLELGRLYRAQKKFRRAQAALEEALSELDRYPKVVQADVLISYGRLMLDRRRSATALKSFREAAKRGAPEGYYRIAYAQYTGNAEAKAEAKRACDKLMEGGSSSGYAKKARPLCGRL
ncbi:MAG: tetratricopeptide repeat protein, partial [Myxococcota bacterium]